MMYAMLAKLLHGRPLIKVKIFGSSSAYHGTLHFIEHHTFENYW